MSESEKTNRHVLVTGSTRGIGLSVAETLLKDGYSVTLHGRTESTRAKEEVERLSQIFEGRVNFCHFDVSDAAAVEAGVTELLSSVRRFYGVVCNAGITADVPMAGMSLEQWSSVVTTNLSSFFHVVQPLLMPMIKGRNGGRIVVISSLSGLVGQRGQVNYSAAKAGQIGAVKALAKELASRRITVNCVAPGAVETEMIPEQQLAAMVEAVPMKRACRPEEVAHAVSFLFQPLSEYITGHTLTLSGGIA